MDKKPHIKPKTIRPVKSMCSATTRAGNPCKAYFASGFTTCALHTPSIKAVAEAHKALVKEKNRPPTIQQEKLGEIIVRDTLAGKKTTKTAQLAEAGYSPTNQTTNVIQSKGVQSVLAKHGLTMDIAVKRHRAIIKDGKDQVALRAVDLAYEVEGLKNKQQNTTFFNILSLVNPPSNDDS